MSFVLLGILNSQAAATGVVYRLQTLGGSNSDVGDSVSLDSSDNIYVFGQTESTGAGAADFLLAKYDSSGNIQWQRILGGSGNEIGNSVAVDSLNNIYVFGWTRSIGEGNRDFLLVKYDDSGTVLWQRILGGSGFDNGESVAVDSNDNVYVFGTFDITGVSDFLLAKYDSSGSIQWQRSLVGSGEEQGYSVAIDSSDNVYVFGNTTSTGGGDDFLLAKYNSSGTVQWQRILGGSSSEQGFSVAIDSSDNVYVLGLTSSTGAGGDDFLLAKYDSSGSIQWQRTLGGSSVEEGYSIAIDSSDNVYVVGFTQSTGAFGEFLFAKYDSSGTIQWQRVLGGSGRERGNSISLDSSDNIYVFGETATTGEGNNDFLLAVLPNDGSLTGTYVLDGVNIDYLASSLTASTASLTAGTSSLTNQTTSFIDAAGTLTSSSASLTEHRVDLE